ncbi:MAG: aminodeoxychorismate/anthranilate synthase component II [Flavobacteriales bacterium]|nr:aminodeoxychorismate/anthranilate synthase component II [Flavobacteriales bacterium]
MKVVIIDNYDSFTYNLVHYCEQFAPVVVMRNDCIDRDQIQKGDKIILSPGPGLPAESGELMAVLGEYHLAHAIFGVCLGHQALAEFFGGQLYNLEHVLHGIETACEIVQPDPLFEGVPKNFTVGHYHSWAVDEKSLPEALEVTSRNAEGLVMAIRHRSLPLHGVQFHPESIMTPHGLRMVENFVMHIQQETCFQ